MKSYKGFIITFSVFLILVISGFKFIKFKVREKVHNKIHAFAKNNNHAVEHGELSINLISGNASLKNIKFFALKGKLKTTVFGKVDYVGIKGLSYFSLIENGDIEIRTFTLKNASLTLIRDTTIAESQKAKNKKNRELSIDKIEIENVQLFAKNTSKKVAGKIIDLTANDFIFNTANEKLNLEEFSFKIADVISKDHKKTISGVNGLTYKQNNLSIDHLYSTPLIDPVKYTFSEGISKVNKSLVRSILINNISLEELVNQKIINAESINVSQAYFISYKNKKIESKKDFDPMPQEILKGIPFKFSTNSLKINDASVKYIELSTSSSQPGIASFTNLSIESGKIYNYDLKANPNINIKLNCRFMDSGNLSAKFKFNMIDPLNTVTYSAELKEMSIVNINPISIPLGSAIIRSGNLDLMTVDIIANKHRAGGKLKLQYQNLKIDLIEGDEEDNILKELGKKVLSKAINKFLIPDYKNINEEAPVVYERNPNKSFFNYTWKSIFSGLKWSLDNKFLIPENSKSK